MTGLGRKDETGASWEPRYYKRVKQSAHTRCWGVLLAFSLQLPAVPAPPPPAGQSVPPPATRQAPQAPWESAWSRPLTSSVDVMLAASNDHILTAGPGVTLEARLATSGDVVWTHTLTTWQALATTGTLVLGVSEDHAYALDAATGTTRWVTQTTGANTRLVVSAGHLLMVSDTDVLLRNVETGTPIWNAALTAPPSAPASLSAESVAVALRDGSVVSFDLASGAPRWRASLSGPPTAITIGQSSVYAALDGTLYALDNRNGRERWSFRLRVPIVGSLVVDETTLYVALLDNSLRVFDAGSGAMRRTDALGHRPAAGPWMSATTVLVALTTGEFLAVDSTNGRLVGRIHLPDNPVSQLLEEATVGPDAGWLATVTTAPGGERRLSVYRRRRPAAVVTTQEAVGGAVPSPGTTATSPPSEPTNPSALQGPAPAVTPAPPGQPRPFPTPR